MRNLILSLLMLVGIAANASEIITVTLTTTNSAVTSNTFVLNGSTRTFTNAYSSTTILTNLTSIPATASNVAAALALYPVSGSYYSFKWLTATQLAFVGAPAQAMSGSIGGGWGYITLSTNTGTNAIAVRVPVEIESLANRTNIATNLVNALVTYATGVDQFSAQTLTNKTLTNSFLGAYQSPVIVRHLRMDSADGSGFKPGIEFTDNGGNYVAFLSPDWEGGFPALYSNSPSINYEPMDSSAVAFDHPEIILNWRTASQLLPTYYANKTNTWSQFNVNYFLGTNYHSGEDRFGTLLATNTHLYGWLQTDGSVTNNGAWYWDGNLTQSDSSDAKFGNLYSFTTALLTNASIYAGSATNFNANGTKKTTFTPEGNSNPANGNNTGVILGTNTYNRITGPTTIAAFGGFVAEPAGSFHVIQFSGGITNYLVNEGSGTWSQDATAGNRILTGTGGDIAMTNQPAMAILIYDGTSSRWRVVQHSR